MASPTGFEPVAFPLGGGRSIQLSYGDNGAHYMQKIALRSSGYPRALEIRLRKSRALGVFRWRFKAEEIKIHMPTGFLRSEIKQAEAITHKVRQGIAHF